MYYRSGFSRTQLASKLNLLQDIENAVNISLSQKIIFRPLNEVYKINIFSRVLVTTDRNFGLNGWTYCTLHVHNSGLQAIQRNRWFTQFTIHHCSRNRILSIGWNGMDWIDLAQDRNQWRALVKTVMNFRVSIKFWEFLE
jgi:hypothetical protein